MNFLVKSTGYLSLAVPDIDEAIRESSVFGARLVERTPTRALLSSNRRRAELVLNVADRSGLCVVGVEAVDADAIDEVKCRAIAAGLRIFSEQPLLEFVEKAVSFVTTQGHVIEIHMPIPEDQPLDPSRPGLRPDRLDHVNLTSADPEQTTRELQQVLGMRLNERSDTYDSVFLGGADSRHHIIAMGHNAVSGLHHYSWELLDFHQFKQMGDILDVENMPLIWGPGRHGAGDNVFAYRLDRQGLMVECSSEMKIIDGENFETSVFHSGLPKVANRWGPMPPAEWIFHASPNIYL